jgi:hypothetical protein
MRGPLYETLLARQYVQLRIDNRSRQLLARPLDITMRLYAARRKSTGPVTLFPRSGPVEPLNICRHSKTDFPCPVRFYTWNGRSPVRLVPLEGTGNLMAIFFLRPKRKKRTASTEGTDSSVQIKDMVVGHIFRGRPTIRRNPGAGPRPSLPLFRFFNGQISVGTNLFLRPRPVAGRLLALWNQLGPALSACRPPARICASPAAL